MDTPHIPTNPYVCSVSCGTTSTSDSSVLHDEVSCYKLIMKKRDSNVLPICYISASEIVTHLHVNSTYMQITT